MLRNSPPISDFARPIPICQPETDLGSVLNLFQNFNCRFLAVPLKNRNWGIINSGDLASLLAIPWQKERSALVSRLRSVDVQPNIPHLLNQDLNSIVEPAKILQGDRKLTEFLDCLEHESIFENESEYLIVDAKRELQGRLDRDRVIRYLASKPQHAISSVQNSTSFSHLSSLIDAVALPIKIETSAGKELYLNQYWQEIFSNQENSQPVDKTNTQIASWWIQQQHKHSKWGDNSAPSSANPDSLEERSFNASNEQYCDRSEKKSASSSSLVQLGSQLGIEIEQRSDWNYIRIPLIAEKQFLAEREPCWLVLAIKIPAISNSNLNTISSLGTSNIANNLLATISHELKSPLTGIVGLSSLLNKQKLGSLNQRQARYVKLIHRSAQKMMSIVEDLLKLTSLATDRSLEPELINLEFLCRQLYQQVLTKLQARDLAEVAAIDSAALKFDIEQGTEVVLANKSLLSSLLTHLILEAIRLPESGNQIEIKIVNLQGQTAIGISSNLMIYRSSPLPSEASALPDSGLDLVIAEYLAVALRGSLTVSHSGDRCQFTLLLSPNQTNQLHQQSVNNFSITQTQPKATTNLTIHLTILCLYPELDAIDPEANHLNESSFDLKSWSDNDKQQMDCPHRIIEADSLEQAHNLARIWQLDAIILDGYQIVQPSAYLRSLQESEHLSALPLITLDTGTTEAANQIPGLNVYPCLLLAKYRSIEDLMQVIKIATEQ